VRRLAEAAAIARKPAENKDSRKAGSDSVTTPVYHLFGDSGRHFESLQDANPSAIVVLERANCEATAFTSRWTIAAAPPATALLLQRTAPSSRSLLC